ncbi:hypothetical protein LTR36_003100 [Oleoguttula mirabilis]|uniref:Uncharacterized protein n=1 Tax=Oleoguttula mirabilis TaxID=1507867 RepID=A0AAV9JWX8_9PEZI|nr:hypothetical protein LTR36_003100 [Oleoguttula mirabilis]
MFCTALRRRPSFVAVLPSLTSASGPALRESQLDTHDISLPVNSAVDPKTGNTVSTRQLRLLLLSSTSVSEVKLNDTIKRIRHFASLTGGQDLAIVFLLSQPQVTTFVSAKQLAVHGATTASTTDDAEGVYAYSKVQAELMNKPDIPNIPVLPLASLEGLPALLRKHVANLTHVHTQSHAAAATPVVASPFELLQLCTANPPMPQQTAYILSDLFPNIKVLAETCTSVTSAPSSSSPSARAAVLAGMDESSQMGDPYGLSTQGTEVSDSAHGKLKTLRDLVGEQQCLDVVDFWREEWTVD